MRRWFVLFFLAIALAIFFQTNSTNAYAAVLPSIGVSPDIKSLVLLPKQSTASYNSVITNNSAETVAVTVSTANFTTLGENGNIEFLPAGNADSHSLATSLSVNNSSFLLPAHSAQTVVVNVNEANQLSVGGHYAAVLFQINALSNATSQSHVTLHQTVASLVFLSTDGQGTYGINLLPFKQSIALLHFPGSFNFIFNNTGNTQTTPRGYFTITGPFHKLISKSIINENSALVLPGTDRLIQTSDTPIRNAWLPGLYTLHVFYRYDGASNFTAVNINFIYFNLLAGVIIIIVFSALLLLLAKYTFSVRNRRS